MRIMFFFIVHLIDKSWTNITISSEYTAKKKRWPPIHIEGTPGHYSIMKGKMLIKNQFSFSESKNSKLFTTTKIFE